jgi:hypothetical protein
MFDVATTTLVAAAVGIFFLLLLVRVLRLPNSFYERQKQLEELRKHMLLQQLAGTQESVDYVAESEKEQQ